MLAQHTESASVSLILCYESQQFVTIRYNSLQYVTIPYLLQFVTNLLQMPCANQRRPETVFETSIFHAHAQSKK